MGRRALLVRVRGPGKGLSFPFVITLALCILYAPARALAHGLAIYASTPISPPEGVFTLILPGFVLCSSGVSLVALARTLGWRSAAGWSFMANVAFALAFFVWGSYASQVTTAPPPGLGSPHPVFWGLGWKTVGDVFFEWNLKGVVLLFLVQVILACRARWRMGIGRIALLLFAPVLLYGGWLVPYVTTGAYAHGWAGSYVYGACPDNIGLMRSGLWFYADEHEGRLPKASSLEGLVEEIIAEGIFDPKLRDRLPWAACPVARCYEREPRPYVWNGKWAGRRISEIPVEEVLLRCPYHTDWDKAMLRAGTLLRR